METVKVTGYKCKHFEADIDDQNELQVPHDELFVVILRLQDDGKVRNQEQRQRR